MKCSQLFRKLKKAGWFVKSQKGSHKVLSRPDYAKKITFPDHNSTEVTNGIAAKIKKLTGLGL
ncbi:type II toxin-antitoxin system HicA family toxin [Pedobacter sp. MC2016-24]|uniref:type II toxin-antitoxin system HicA family toxin n=1 Tax=Pedobacter sp. MC2016-24 TaxID=2780090 RepID=UPI0018801C68|nr:type II toxin-antitoxin system HicA family toxin [Pedobacter sp. MC2016-24]